MPQTEGLWAFQVEQDDFIVTDEEVVAQVREKQDNTDHIVLITKDEDGETVHRTFGPFDTISVVTSFEDEE